MKGVTSSDSPNGLPFVGRKRTIRILYVIGFMDLCAVSMIVTLIPKFILNLGATPFLVGLLGSVYGGVQVLSSPAVGRLSDVYGRKPVLVLSYVGPALGYVMMGVSSSLWMIVLSRVVLGTLKQGLSVSKAYLVDLVSPSEQQTVIGFFNSCSSFGFIIGPLIGGELAVLDSSLRLPFLTCGIFFVIISILVMFYLPGERGVIASSSQQSSADGTGGIFERIKSSFLPSTDLNLRRLADLFFLRFLMALAVLIFRNNYPLYLDDRYGVDYRTLGKVMSFSGIVGAASSALSGSVGRMYSNVSTLYFHGTVVLAASLLLALSSSASFAIVALLPLSLATSNIKVTSTTMMLARVPPNQKGAVIGLGNSLTSLSRMIAPLLVGLAQEASTTTACLLSVVLSVSASGLTGILLLTSW